MKHISYPGTACRTGGNLSGEDNSQSQVSNAEARAARELRHDFEMTMQELATMYGISRPAMSYILRGKTYKEAGGPLDPGRRPPGSGRANPRHRAKVKT